MDILLQDTHYGWRTLRKSPGFTLVGVLTLALGIGANTAIFSVISGVLLNSLPFPQPDQLVTLHESKPNFQQGSVSYPNFRDWQRENRTFGSMAVSRGYSLSLTGLGEAEQVGVEFISADFFPLLRVKPVIGRVFEPGEDEIGAAPVALVSEGFWQRKLSSAHDVLGKSLTLNGKNYTIVGMIPSSFHLLLPSFRERELYVPIGQWNNPLLPKREAGLGIHGIGRLKPGVSIEQARADMERVSRNLAMAYPDANKSISAKVIPLKQQMVGAVRPFLLVLLGAVGFVLLIAGVNVANLMLARSTGRIREFAIRAALGASPARMLRQLLTESVLIALIGGAVGLALAAWGTSAALHFLPVTLPRADEIGLDPRVLAFTAAISLLAGILFGLVPALKAKSSNLQSNLQEGGRNLGGAHHRAQGVFITVEIGLALVLLTGAGLMIRSLVQLWRVDPGFNPENVLFVNLSLSPSMMTANPAAIRAAFHEIDDRVSNIPGVVAVSQTWEALPMSGDDEQQFWLEGQPKPASGNDMNWAIDYIVGPDYLKTMGIPLKRGRFFARNDDDHAQTVVVIDEVLATKFFPNHDPIGRRINLNSSGKLATIIGVVGHVKQWGLDTDDTEHLRAQFYLPWMQMPDDYVSLVSSGAGMLMRSAAPVSGLLDSVRHLSAQMSAEQVVFGAQTMDAIIAESLATRRFAMILLGVFAGLALVLASIGIYGVISFVVGQRTQEIGIRMALGAQRMDVLRLVLEQGGRLALIGVVLGVIAALGLTRFMTSVLYGVPATDPLTFIAGAILVILVALSACYMPARRASKVDPMIALRYE
jgi:predicted permease